MEGKNDIVKGAEKMMLLHATRGEASKVETMFNQPAPQPERVDTREDLEIFENQFARGLRW